MTIDENGHCSEETDAETDGPPGSRRENPSRSESRDTPTTRSKDGVFEALSDPNRRRILWYLYTAEEDVTSIPDLLDSLVTDLEKRRGRIETLLYHAHLPMLAERGLIDYDRRSETIRYHGDAVAEEHLEALSESDSFG